MEQVHFTATYGDAHDSRRPLSLGEIVTAMKESGELNVADTQELQQQVNEASHFRPTPPREVQ